MVGRLDRQGTGLCCLFWDVDDFGARLFETKFRLSCCRGQRQRSCVLASNGCVGFVTGMHWLKVSAGIQARAFGCPLSKIPGLPFWACGCCRPGLPFPGLVVVVVRGFPFRGLWLLSSGASLSGACGCCRPGLPFPGLVVVVVRGFPFRGLWLLSSGASLSGACGCCRPGLPFPGLVVVVVRGFPFRGLWLLSSGASLSGACGCCRPGLPFPGLVVVVVRGFPFRGLWLLSSGASLSGACGCCRPGLTP